MFELTPKKAQEILQANSRFAPIAAQYIVVDPEGKVYFAETLSRTGLLWDAESLRECQKAVAIMGLYPIAKRNAPNTWKLLAIKEKGEPSGNRAQRMLKHQQALTSARVVQPAVTTIDVAKATTTIVAAAKELTKEVIKADPVIEPVPAVKANTLLVVDEAPIIIGDINLSEFISLRSLETVPRKLKEGELLLSLRSNGKIVLSRTLRNRVEGWEGMNILVSKDFRRVAVCMGNDYEPNKSGTYMSRALTSKLKFPDDSGTIRVLLAWDKGLNAFVGDIH